MIICSYNNLVLLDSKSIKKEVKKMATVITVPRDSSLQFRLVVGTNPETGAPIINSKTFAKIKSAALDQDVYDAATALEGLQKYTVDEIRLEKESQLTE
jgi:hypothetical protein